MPVDSDGLPLISACSKLDFYELYTSPEVASSFEALYENKNGIQDKMMDYWSVVSKRFADNEYVIGYDIINEPWAANIYKETDLFFNPLKFDHDKLYPLAVNAEAAVRPNDDEGIIFFESAQFPDTWPFFGGVPFHTGFPKTPGGKAYLNRQALNDHTYCCQAAGDMCAAGEPPLDRFQECRDFHMLKV